jgi:hypothetical protein
MHIPFVITSSVLWVAVAASVTVVILDDFSLPSLAFLFFAIAAICYLLSTHLHELRARYEAAEARVALPGKYDEQIYGEYKPTFRHMAPGLVVMGLACFYYAYEAAHGSNLSGITKIIHSFLGIPGVVAFWTVVGVTLLAKASDAVIGSRVKKRGR